MEISSLDIKKRFFRQKTSGMYNRRCLKTGEIYRVKQTEYDLEPQNVYKVLFHREQRWYLQHSIMENLHFETYQCILSRYPEKPLSRNAHVTWKS
jgi:hypothetical protein